MALNPPINDQGLPMKVEGEYFVLHRKDMEIEAIIENGGKRTAKGTLYVTTARLVFTNKNHATESFKAFDIPILNIFEEKFEQPIFGANYLFLKCKPLHGLLPGNTKIKLWFMSGGCSKFLKYFVQILTQVRQRKQQGPDATFLKHLNSGSLESHFGYVDPSDPTTVFVNQPEGDYSNSSFQSYYQPQMNQNGGSQPLNTVTTQNTQSPTLNQSPNFQVNYAPVSNSVPVTINNSYNDVTNAQIQQPTQQNKYFTGQGVSLGGTDIQSQQFQQNQYQTTQVIQPQYNQQYNPIPTQTTQFTQLQQPQQYSGTGLSAGGTVVQNSQQNYIPSSNSFGQQQQQPTYISNQNYVQQIPTTSFGTYDQQQQQPYVQTTNTYGQQQQSTGLQTIPQTQQQSFAPQNQMGVNGQVQYPSFQQQQQQPIPQQQPVQQNPNVGWYYGFQFGPRLERNDF